MPPTPLALGRSLEPWIATAPATGQQAVATANPLASWAAIRILRAGGTAIDAAVAAQAVLTLVEPNASGLGGGAIIVTHHRGATHTYDGLSAAPAAAPDRITAETGGLAVGTPGALAALALAHAAHGKLPWAALFDDAITLAEEGFALSPYLHRMLHTHDLRAMLDEPQSVALYAGLPAGSTTRNPALAATLRAIARNGAAEFYTGQTAHRIAATVQSAGGVLTTADLAAYRAIERPPIRFALGGNTVLGGALPSYGSISAGQIVGIAAALGLHSLPETPGAEAIHILATAGRLAQADRFPYADPDFEPLDAQRLLDPAYLAARARLHNPAHLPPTLPGGHEGGGSMTSHLSIADAAGRVVAMTTTINQNFGAQLSVAGFYLNNVMTNFATTPIRDGRTMPNAAQPNKRARTTIAPCIVLNPNGTPLAAIGAGGGHRIIGFVANALLRLAGGNRNPQAILAAPHALNWEGTTEIEPELAPHADALHARAHKLAIRRLEAGAQMVILHDGLASAGADPRRDGMGMASE